MDTAKARDRYHAQRYHAIRRGIEWKLTFREWLDWWGDDLDRRGSGKDNLQMQRKLDQGPYALGNIEKGTPKQNSSTYSYVYQGRKRERDVRRPTAYLAPNPISRDDGRDGESISEYMERTGGVNYCRSVWE